MPSKLSGFTLMELMIVVAIIGVLVAIAIPSYQNYTRRAQYTEVVQAVLPYKLGIEECYQTTGELLQCSAGKNGVPPAIPAGQGVGLVDAIQVSEQGEIHAIPKNQSGIKPEDDYQLKPSIQNNRLVWKSSGGAVELGYAR